MSARRIRSRRANRSVAHGGTARSGSRATGQATKKTRPSAGETSPDLVVEVGTFKPTEREFNEWIEALALFLLDDSNGCGGR